MRCSDDRAKASRIVSGQFSRNLRAGYVDEDGIAFPKWEKVTEGQRDYSAEAMGY